MQPAINGGRALSPPYISSCTRGWWWGMPGVQLVSYLGGALGAPGSHQLSVGKPIKQSKHFSSCNQPLPHSASECISLDLSFNLSFGNHVNPSRSSMMSSQAGLPICETARQTRGRPTRSVNSCQIGGVCFLHLGGGAWRGGIPMFLRGNEDFVLTH